MAMNETQILSLTAGSHTLPGGNQYKLRKIGDGGQAHLSERGTTPVRMKEDEEVFISHELGGDHTIVVSEGISLMIHRVEPEHPNTGLGDHDNPGLHEGDPADAPILQHPDMGVVIKDPAKVLPADEARSEPAFDRGLSFQDRVNSLAEAARRGDIDQGSPAEGSSADGLGANDIRRHGPIIAPPFESVEDSDSDEPAAIAPLLPVPDSIDDRAMDNNQSASGAAAASQEAGMEKADAGSQNFPGDNPVENENQDDPRNISSGSRRRGGLFGRLLGDDEEGR